MEQTSTITRKLSIKIFKENKKKTQKTYVIFRYVIISEQQNV